MHFNSHAHVERDCVLRGNTRQSLYFNSHAHVERDLNGCCDLFIFHISTHTLTWSVTSITQVDVRPITDFNSHAHVERDRSVMNMNVLPKNFNSHAHVERDKKRVIIGVIIVDFNSHAHVERDCRQRNR